MRSHNVRPVIVVMAMVWLMLSSVCDLASTQHLWTSRRPRTTISFHRNQNPLTEVTFVNLMVCALLKDVKDPIRLAGRLSEEANRILKHARSYLMEIQEAECHLKEDYRMSYEDINKYQNLWANSMEELNRLEAMFRQREEINNPTCN